MKVKFSILLAIAATLFACEKDPKHGPSAPGKYSKGIFVVNEGPFGSTGDITFINPDSNKVVQNIFQLENDGATLGSFPQSLTFHDGKGYICATELNKIFVVNAETFETEAVINGFAKPRYFLPVGSKFALVSQWGLNGADGKVLKIDLLENRILDSVKVGNGPEKMFPLDNQTVIVPNVGGYSVDSTLSFLNWQTMKVESTSVTGSQNPACLVSPNFGSGKPFVLCQGVFSELNSGWIGGHLSPKTDGFSLPNHFTNDIAVSNSGEEIFISAGGAVHKMDKNGLVKAFDFDAYGLSLDPKTGNLLCADAKGFGTKGVLKILTTAGEEKASFEVGVGPGEIIIKE